MSELVNCRIQMYDPEVTEPPFEFITLGEAQVETVDNDYLGEAFYMNLRRACSEQGFCMKFYSRSTSPDYVYDITVLDDGISAIMARLKE